MQVYTLPCLKKPSPEILALLHMDERHFQNHIFQVSSLLNCEVIVCKQMGSQKTHWDGLCFDHSQAKSS
jgi:hypothetical protein